MRDKQKQKPNPKVIKKKILDFSIKKNDNLYDVYVLLETNHDVPVYNLYILFFPMNTIELLIHVKQNKNRVKYSSKNKKSLKSI